MVANYAERRRALKKVINDPKSSPEQVDEAVLKLQKMPRDASPVRVRNRCSQTGRPRGSCGNSASRASRFATLHVRDRSPAL
ncbi:MAG: 30S ribosomal protein S14 [Acidobacteria bacterium OLB17]|nr:MAG: 30S ribosomal protein S14 [Acidobacteria bacterium OLB17]